MNKKYYNTNERNAYNVNDAVPSNLLELKLGNLPGKKKGKVDLTLQIAQLGVSSNVLTQLFSGIFVRVENNVETDKLKIPNDDYDFDAVLTPQPYYCGLAYSGQLLQAAVFTTKKSIEYTTYASSIFLSFWVSESHGIASTLNSTAIAIFNPIDKKQILTNSRNPAGFWGFNLNCYDSSITTNIKYNTVVTYENSFELS